MENKTTDNLTDTIQNAETLPDIAESTEGWELTLAQLQFMRAHQIEIETAYETDDDSFFEALMTSTEFINLFGDMGWDEAYDRFEVWLENQS